jgi:hypothetical protein
MDRSVEIECGDKLERYACEALGHRNLMALSTKASLDGYYYQPRSIHLPECDADEAISSRSIDTYNQAESCVERP